MLANNEFPKAESFVVVEIIEYIPNAVVIKAIMQKSTGNVTVSSFDSGEALTDKTSAFDTFIQVIDGKAEVEIDGLAYSLDIGQAIIIPANARNTIKANMRFKMISTVIKSGYGEVS
jgi:quercetin dioxygenase-like cupin family protein